jgi:transposase
MEILYQKCAGLDVHKKTVVACRLRTGQEGQVEQESKTFGTKTVELLALVDWLSEWELTHVAMESTGDYWKPVYNLLEGNFEVVLVNAKHVRHVPGRKTDVSDAEWLAELMRYGLLKGSFIPPQVQRDLRDLTRYRTRVVRERARLVNRVQKLLEGANIKLSSVATDILGKSGRAMLEALVAGEREPAAMAELAKGRLRNKRSELEQALTGLVRPHHRFLLAQQLRHIDFLNEQIEALGQEIERQLAVREADSAAGQSPPKAIDPETGEVKPAATEPGQPLSFSQAVALLDTIPGVNQRTAEVIVAELGTDMSRFPTANHAAAWAGVAPGNNQSGGKRYSGKTRDGNQALQDALSEAAWAAARTKGTYLSTLYHRLAGRRGKKRAIVAVAHSILVSAYYMLSRHEPYRDLGSNYFDERKQEAVINRLLHRLHKLGFSVTIEPAAVPA